MVSIVIEVDGQLPRTQRIAHFPCRIGRGPDADVRLPGWRVGRIHAELHQIGRGLRLVDAGTIGGTWVNGVRITEFAPLADVDELTIAAYRLRVVGAGLPMQQTPTQQPSGWQSGFSDAGQSSRASDAPPSSPACPPPGPRDDGALIAPVLPQTPQTSGIDPGAAIDALSAQPGVREAVSASVIAPSTVLTGRPARSAPAVDPLALERRRLLHRQLLQTIDLRRRDIRHLSPEQLRVEARALLEEILRADDGVRDSDGVERLIEDVLDEAIGLGPLERLMADPSVSEIMVNAPEAIYIEREGRLSRTGLAFSGETAVRSVIDRIVAPLGRRVDEGSPMVDARLPDGSRVNAIVPPLAVRGAALTIRRFNRRLLSPDDLLAVGSASARMIALLRLAVLHRRNIVISGGTGSGKTTLLNLLSNLIPEDERIVTIEDAAELRLDHEHLVSLEARPPNAEGRGAVQIRELVRNALRMRPDRIVVGECRGGEALDMLQAMNTGHDGSLTTIHANTPRDAVSRLETMVLMAGMDLPVSAIRDQIASAVHLIVQQVRAADGRRRIVEITEVTGLEGSRVLMQSIFRWERGDFASTGAVPVFIERLRASGEAIEWHCPQPESIR